MGSRRRPFARRYKQSRSVYPAVGFFFSIQREFFFFQRQSILTYTTGCGFRVIALTRGEKRARHDANSFFFFFFFDNVRYSHCIVGSVYLDARVRCFAYAKIKLAQSVPANFADFLLLSQSTSSLSLQRGTSSVAGSQKHRQSYNCPARSGNQEATRIVSRA